MSALIRPFGLSLAACVVAALTSASSASDGPKNPPLGAWMSTNDCFLAAFVISEGGHAQAVYMTGEQDNFATWTWDGTTLHILSKTFDLDRFDAHVAADDRIEANYTWHDLDNNVLHPQACVFERFGSQGV